MKARSLTLALFVSLVVMAAAASGSAQATLVVTKTADTADGTCDLDCSVREAVSAAASGDLIVFSKLFSIPRTITLTSQKQ